jgi:hypothetical protein
LSRFVAMFAPFCHIMSGLLCEALAGVTIRFGLTLARLWGKESAHERFLSRGADEQLC